MAKKAATPRRPAKRKATKPAAGELVLIATPKPAAATAAPSWLRLVPGIVLCLSLCATGVWLLVPDAAGPAADSVFAQCCEAQRVAEVAILRELAGKEFSNDQAKMDWLNGQRIEKRAAAFAPYTDAIAEAIVSGKVSEFADRLEAGK